jgi:ADP-glucose pyrophosphorylase
VLTQFNSVSLHRHISQTYVFDSFHSGWVQIWRRNRPWNTPIGIRAPRTPSVSN